MDERYMEVALELARATVGQTSPNPVVGAVVVKDGRIVGMGAHLKAGEAHAEVQALTMAGSHAEGATVYVTLEPCCHYGKTPPCTELLKSKKVRRVVIATVDPNPLVARKGVKQLQEAGIDVTVGTCEKEALELNRFFFTAMSKHRPYITLKAALSLDGKMATRNGYSHWITSEEARKRVHEERKIHDGILVGVETIVRDNPTLTVRYELGGKNPTPIILDTNLRTPIDSNIFQHHSKSMIVVGSDVDECRMNVYKEMGVDIIQMDTDRIHVEEVLPILFEKEMHAIYVEGGSSVHSSFVEKGLYDEIIVYIAPKIIGGLHKGVFLHQFGFEKIEDSPTLHMTEVEKIGSDLRIVYRKETLCLQAL